MRELNYQQALSKTMAICSKSEKCISEIETKLKSWNISNDNVDKIIDELIAQKFIDEERFTAYYIRDKFRFNRWGKVKIRYMLSGKGIPATMINTAIEEEISEESYLETLSQLLSDKQRSIKSDSEFETKAKLIRFAQSRGFEYDAINKALSTIEHNS